MLNIRRLLSVSNIKSVNRTILKNRFPIPLPRYFSSNESATVVTHNPERVDALLREWNCVSNKDFKDLAKEVIENPKYQKIVQGSLIDGKSWTDYVYAKVNTLKSEPLPTFTLEELEELTTNLLVGADESIPLEIQTTNKQSAAEKLFEVLYRNASSDLAHVITANQLLSSQTNMQAPHDWYPYPRIMKRKVIFHGGPTNSGKTYQAMQRLKKASAEKGGGIYCSPLRLLAAEIYERLNKEGIHCNLMTGQERRTIPLATHLACTIEMTNIGVDYDVAVIDEIQMISDSTRGHSWTRVFLGIRANEVHLCGGLEAADIIRRLCESTGDDFTLIEYQRLSTFSVEEHSLRGDYSKVQKGDCIVCFSKNDIFAIQQEIEKVTKKKCAIIYGELPPETRSLQARLFNDPDSEYDILVSTDAIGMGLNLNIRRVIFHTVLKGNPEHNDVHTLFISPSHIKQIAGRAGRKGSIYEHGLITTWQEADLAYVKAVMNWTVPTIRSAGLFPGVDQIQLFYEKIIQLLFPEVQQLIENEADAKKTAALVSTVIPLAKVLERFIELSKTDTRYFVCSIENLATMANWLHTIPLTLTDRFIFALCPINLRDQLIPNVIYKYASIYANNLPVRLGVKLNKSAPKTEEEFNLLVQQSTIIDTYLWLAHRFPTHFIEVEHAVSLRTIALRQIEEALGFNIKFGAKSFAQRYRSIQLRLKNMKAKEDPIPLPPKEYSDEIRKAYYENMLKIPVKDRFIDRSSATLMKKRKSEVVNNNREMNEEIPDYLKDPDEIEFDRQRKRQQKQSKDSPNRMRSGRRKASGAERKKSVALMPTSSRLSRSRKADEEVKKVETEEFEREELQAHTILSSIPN